MTDPNPLDSSRGSIAANNFFALLREKKITNRKYAEDNALGATTLSKWKSGASSMTLEQIKQAADYLGVTVNDLIYSEREKKAIQVLSSKEPYHPILAQQTVTLRRMDTVFANPLETLLPAILSFGLISLLVFFLVRFNPYWVFLLLLPLLVWLLFFRRPLGKKEVFTLPYLDDIYFHMASNRNPYFAAELILMIVFSLASFSYLPLLVWLADYHNENLSFLIGFSDRLALLEFFFSLTSFATLRRTYAPAVYTKGLWPFFYQLAGVIFSFLVAGVMLALLSLDFKDLWSLLFPLALSVASAFLGFCFVSRKYHDYRLVYSEYGKPLRDLYPHC